MMKQTLLHHGRLLAIALVLALSFPAVSSAQLSGIRYTVAPRADRMFFDDNSGLADLTMLSGRLGFGFGEYLEFSAVGRYSPAGETDFSRYSDLGDPSIYLFDVLPSRDVTQFQYGADIKINFGSGLAVPYASLGTGILHLEPDGLDNIETIYLAGSVGLRYRWQDRVTFTLEAQRQAWRMNAAAMLSDTDLTSLALAREDFRTTGMGAYAIGAGISFDLGGRTRGTKTELDMAMSNQFGGGFSAVRLEVEPFVGNVDFAPALGYQNSQRMSGVSAGLDFGPYVGVRGFYWRGLDDGNSVAFSDLQAYGGELEMAFGSPARRFRPSLTVGGGYLDAMSGYTGNGTAEPEDRPFATAGVSTSIQAGRYLSLHGGVKSLLSSTVEASEVSTPTSVETSWMYFGGLSFELGRGGFTAKREPAAKPMGAMQDELALGETTEMVALKAELARQQRLIDQLMASATVAETPAEQAVPPVASATATVTATDSLTVVAMPAASTVVPAAASAKPAATERPREWITVPVPEEGEIYIRFGSPSQTQSQDAVFFLDPATGALRPAKTPAVMAPDSVTTRTMGSAGASGLSAEQVRAIATEVNREAAQPAAAQPSQADLTAFEARLDARFKALDQKMESQSRSAATPATPAASGAASAEAEPASGDSEGIGRPPLKLRALSPATGYNFNSPRTLLIGARAEMAREGSAYKVLGDVVVGVGPTTTWSITANAVTDFRVPRAGETRVYFGPGVGFISDGDAQLFLNLLAGARYPVGPGQAFGELQTHDLGNNNRILVGYRIGFSSSPTRSHGHAVCAPHRGANSRHRAGHRSGLPSGDALRASPPRRPPHHHHPRAGRNRIRNRQPNLSQHRRSSPCSSFDPGPDQPGAKARGHGADAPCDGCTDGQRAPVVGGFASNRPRIAAGLPGRSGRPRARSRRCRAVD